MSIMGRGNAIRSMLHRRVRWPQAAIGALVVVVATIRIVRPPPPPGRVSRVRCSSTEPVDLAVCALPLGQASVTAPAEMQLDHSSTVALSVRPVGRDASEGPLIRALTANSGILIHTKRVRYSSRMVARLWGSRV